MISYQSLLLSTIVLNDRGLYNWLDQTQRSTVYWESSAEEEFRESPPFA